jgi:phosphatidylglycerophosphate synthase
MPPIDAIRAWQLAHAILVLATVPFSFAEAKNVLLAPSLFGALSISALLLSHVRSRELYTYANCVTAARLFGALYVASNSPALPSMRLGLFAIVFVGADFVDGYLAKRFRQCYPLGATFDEQTDALATLMCGATLWQRGLAGPVAIHMACATYIYRVLLHFINPSHVWNLPHARTLAGVMGVLSIGSLLAADHSMPFGRLLGDAAAVVNLGSFLLSYWKLIRS